MANSKRRCSVCKNYFPVRDFYRPHICSVACFLERQAEQRRRNNARKRDRQRKKYGATSLPTEYKRRIRARDGDCCRWCGTTQRLHVHHIEYRSQGGSDQRHNLITLCEEHHDVVHSNKRRYQPLCRAYIWALYVEGRQLTLPQLERWLAVAA